jgi:hypothetical protein
MSGFEQLLMSPATETLLYENGKSDCERGITYYDGWKEICKDLGWDHRGRTPAQERYLDGYYSGVFGSKKNAGSAPAEPIRP